MQRNHNRAQLIAPTCALDSAKPKHNYVLKYVSAAVGETDAPETIAEFISQRRR